MLQEDEELFKYYISSIQQNLDLNNSRIFKDYKFLNLKEGENNKKIL